jgi:hypothetical protein
MCSNIPASPYAKYIIAIIREKLSYDARLGIITDQVYSVAIELKVNV